MRKTVLAMALMVAVGALQTWAPQAWAQQQGGSSSVQKNGPLLEAPIGHRQPRRGDVPSEKNLSDPNSAMNKEDAALDKKIKSICRGC
ncbi:hypothetical protein CI1B_58870 [Bradyrhizobium ivorense]|uniref:Uncharacterized protein n=1 Tax=Bradyrhizobium ivorense TaxID=2511166 RepID=A0A508TMA6_9BRAD|nr:hypothetical protein [Bradyrhizobium ivorense]VIO75383.1 hypothetical protein CI1B_58870 [Bradyrhizobium ivorense]